MSGVSIEMLLEPEPLLSAYAQGYFPMETDGQIQFYTADPRGVLPLDKFHVPRRLAKTARKAPERGGFEIRINTAFHEVIAACRDTRPDERWIGDPIVKAYTELHRLGFAHSVEAWRHGKLAGGLYGVALGGAFFGESMFHYETDASKVALVALVDRLRARGYVLLDTQMVTEHMTQFGTTEIPLRSYMRQLKRALELPREFEDRGAVACG